MANTDSELIDEVSALSGYDSSVLDDPTMQQLVSVAKSEFRSDSGTEFTYDNPDAERALFWLTFLFQKIAVGDIEAPEFSVAEIEQTAEESVQVSFWYRNYQKHASAATGTGFPGGITNIERSNRIYGEDS